MINMRNTIIPKSDQLNNDDLIGGKTLTIKITNVSIVNSDQPASIHFEGDNGKPWKPCKSMCRVMVNVWGDDGRDYIGKHLTLFSDPNVKWGGEKVGGIRISHMEGLTEKRIMPLTATKNTKNPYCVEPLFIEKIEPVSATELEILVEALNDAQSMDDLKEAFTKVQAVKPRLSPDDLKTLTDLKDTIKEKLSATGQAMAESEQNDKV